MAAQEDNDDGSDDRKWLILSTVAMTPRRVLGEPLLRSNDLAAQGNRPFSDGAPTFVDVFAGCGGLTLGLKGNI